MSWGKFKDWLWSQPASASSPGASLTRMVLRIIFIFGREFKHDNIPLRASALTFTIVLSLVPCLALGTAVLKGLGAGDQMRQAAYRLVDQMEAGTTAPAEQKEKTGNNVPAQTPSTLQPDFQQQNPALAEENDTQVSGHLRTAIKQIFDYVDKTDFAKLGAFGVIGLILAVLSVLGSIEKAMNAIWQTKQGRPLGRKIMDYLALMILLPLSVNLALATEATLQNPALFSKINEIIPVAWVTHILLTILPITLVIISFIVLYRFLPNTRVKLLPALIGGILAGMSWLAIQGLYITMQIGVARYNAIYGSFATLPLFLIWLNLAWVIFLAGAEASFACQVWKDYIWDRVKQSPADKLALAFALLEEIHHRHLEKRSPNLAYLEEKFSIYSAAEVRNLLEELTEGGLLLQTKSPKSCFVPNAPASKFQAQEVVDLILGKTMALPHPFAVEALSGAKQRLQNCRITTSTAQ